MYSFHFVVAGRVQGVFFRAATREMAARLGVTGWVRNLVDGRVEGMATGSRTQLEEFRQWLQHGPVHASVSDLVVDEVELQAYDVFSVRPDAGAD